MQIAEKVIVEPMQLIEICRTMSRKIWSKVKESELVQTIKQHPLATIFSIVFAFTSIYLLGIIFLFGLVAVISKEMLKALIEAEATILWFFG